MWVQARYSGQLLILAQVQVQVIQNYILTLNNEIEIYKRLENICIYKAK